MSRTRTVSDILSPSLAALALAVFIAGCTPSTTSTADEGMSYDSDAMVTDPSTNEDSSDTMMSSTAARMNNESSAGMMGSAGMMTSSMGAMMDTSAYEDGTYSADGIYRSPAGTEDIKVTLTLTDDIVTSAQVVGTATNPKSKMMQQAFIDGYSTLVVGKSIDALSLGVINGSSLTPKGFMDAVVKIKAEASAL